MSNAPRLICRMEPAGNQGDLLRLMSSRAETPAFYFEHPSRGLAIAGFGAAAEFRGSGTRRFEDASGAALDLLRSISGRASYAPNAGPLAVGGFSFLDRDPRSPGEWREFPAAWLFIPRLLWVRRSGRCMLTSVWREGAGPGTDAPLARPLKAEASAGGAAERAFAVGLPRRDGYDQWRERVERARSLITSGALRKVVLSRKLEVDFPAPLDPAHIVSAARDSRPACFTFWLRGGQTSFVGSTPELLIGIEADRVTSGALAGSAPRGATAAEDRALGEALFASAKELEEHELVVRAVRSALEGVAGPLGMPERPGLMLLPEAQHLHTPIEGRLRSARSVVEIAGLLHPTPATCGVPLDAARAIIEREEPGRGWYTGMVGWMDARGEGEFAVALRSALAEGSRMLLWAGAGIVAASDPGLEFAETEAKMMALLRSAGIGTAE